MGYDIFDENYWNIVTFADGSWKNDLAYYNAGTSEITYYKENSYTIDEIKAINDRITAKMQMSSLIIQNNYFAYLDESLKKLKEEKSTFAELENSEIFMGG